MELNIEKKEVKVPRSFTLKPSTIALIEEYAELKGVSASQVLDTLTTHFLAKILEQEKAQAGSST